MIELNNCTTCGRKPEIQVIGLCNYAQCKCGKNVSANKGIWTAEVAADMWNRANPQPEREKPDFINFLAAEICKAGLSVSFNEYGGIVFTGKVKTPLPNLAEECLRYRNELNEFYKKRLEPGVKV